MITHIALYQLKDKSSLSKIKAHLEALRQCPLIKENQVKVSCLADIPENTPVLFADIVHIARFATALDAAAYPRSAAHMRLMRETDADIQQVMTMDFVDEIPVLIYNQR